MKDVGFGMTIQDKNAPDLVPLYKLSDRMGMEFATASLHNSFYFVEAGNIIHDRPMVAQNLEALINELLSSRSPKKWFRAYFNHGLINYIYGDVYKRQLFICDVEEAENLSAEAALTYGDYRAAKNGRVSEMPVESEKKTVKKYVCPICHYVYDGDIPFEDLPDSYVCPICKQPKSIFQKIEE